MRRLFPVMLIVIFVGGLALGDLYALPRYEARISGLSAYASVDQPSRFSLSGIVTSIQSAIERAVDSVVRAVSSLFDARPSQPMTKRPVASPPPQTTMPGAEVAPLAASTPTLRPAPTAAPESEGMRVPAPESAATDVNAVVIEVPPDTAKGSFSLFPATPSGTKRFGGESPVAAAPSARPTPAKDPLKYADVDTNRETAARATTIPAAKSVLSAESPAGGPWPASESSLPIPTAQPPPPVSARIEPSDRSRSVSAETVSQPLLYTQPFVSFGTPRSAPAEPVAVRSSPLATSEPVVREPVVAVPRFVDTILPARPVEEPVTVATRDAALPTRTVEDTRTVAPMEEAPAVPETRVADADKTATADTTTTSEPVSISGERAGMIIVSDGRQQVVIQSGDASVIIMDPAVAEAVVCKPTNDFPILSLGEDDAGVTRGVVLNGGTVILNPADFFVKFVRLEGAPFAVDAPPKDCNLRASLLRLSMPDLVLNMPRLSEAEGELVGVKTVVGALGRVYVVAADNAGGKILRGILVREVGATAADSRLLFKMFPERNQLAQVVRSMTATGGLAGRVVADLVLTATDGTTTTQHCEFSRDTEMTCTRGAL